VLQMSVCALLHDDIMLLHDRLSRMWQPIA